MPPKGGTKELKEDALQTYHILARGYILKAAAKADELGDFKRHERYLLAASAMDDANDD